MNHTFIRLLFISFVLLGSSPTFAEKRVALVIGNSAYKHTIALPNPKNDAKALTATLKRLGFDVLGGTDLSRTKFEKVVVAFSKKLRNADVGLFFYAGHGLQVSGQNYLVPIDAELSDEAGLQFSMVKLNDVLAQMERSTKTNLIFIDACRDNPLARNLARSMGRTRSGSIGRGLAPVRSGIGTMITFATEPGNVAQDGDGKNSPFTTALLKHIETPGLDIAPLLRSVRRDVIQATRRQQVPWNHSSLTDSFFFKKGKLRTSKQPIQPAKQMPKFTLLGSWSLVKNGKIKGKPITITKVEAIASRSFWTHKRCNKNFSRCLSQMENVKNKAECSFILVNNNEMKRVCDIFSKKKNTYKRNFTSNFIRDGKL